MLLFQKQNVISGEINARGLNNFLTITIVIT